MQGIARVGDSVAGICSALGHVENLHFSGVWTVSHSSATSDGQGIIVTGDTGNASCGHTFKATTGSSIVTNNNIQVHRVGDQIVIVEGPGTGTTVSGSSVVQAA